MALFFEDLRVGDRWLSPARQVTRDDVVDFAELTGDHDPLHNDNGDSIASPFGKPVAHGLLGLSILAGLSSEHPAVNTLALVKISDWEFDHPVYFGDSVHALTTVIALQPYGRRAGRVTWLRRLLNQNGVTVQSGQMETLVALRSRVPRVAPPSAATAGSSSRAAAGLQTT